LSPDGRRHAYAERTGEDVVVIVDGREIFRAKQSPSAPPVRMLQFTPDGNHVYFFRASGDTTTSVMLVMDGKPASPPVDAILPLMFSADGSHWAFSAGAAKQPLTKVLVIDGKTADYNCESPRISRDGRHVACFSRASTLPAGHARGVLVDGKLTVSGPQLDLLRFSPSGDVFVTVKDTKTNTTTLYRNGTLVEGSEGALTLRFSPDGSHWAAQGMTNLGAARWIMYDGKRQKDYKQVSDVLFAADESAWAYFGQSDKGWHAVINGKEHEPNAVAHGAAFAKTGHSFAYAAGPAAMQVFLNDVAVSAPFKTVFALELSPDGARSAFYTTLSGLIVELVVDGQTKSQGIQYTVVQRIGFSPDSKHVFATAMHPQLKLPTIYLDGAFLPRVVMGLSPQEFTPDSQHLILTGQGAPEQGLTPVLYYVDGDVVAKCSPRALPWLNSPKMVRPKVGVLPWGTSSKPIDPDAKDWEVQPDGSIAFICNTPAPGGYGPIRKVTVTPAAGTSFATWAASLK
jgi:hypothetical protein